MKLDPTTGLMELKQTDLIDRVKETLGLTSLELLEGLLLMKLNHLCGMLMVILPWETLAQQCCWYDPVPGWTLKI